MEVLCETSVFLFAVLKRSLSFHEFGRKTTKFMFLFTCKSLFILELRNNEMIGVEPTIYTVYLLEFRISINQSSWIWCALMHWGCIVWIYLKFEFYTDTLRDMNMCNKSSYKHSIRITLSALYEIKVNFNWSNVLCWTSTISVTVYMYVSLPNEIRILFTNS